MRIELLHAALFTPTVRGWGLPILFEDEPGTAKSSVIEAYAVRCGLPCEVLSPGERGEGAFGVVPVPVKGIMTYPRPDWSDRMTECGLVFVDEVTTAPKMLQAPMLGLVAAKRIGSHQLGPRVRVLGACNPVAQAANGHDLSPPLANRFGWIHWGAPSVEEHTAYMLGAASGHGGDAIDALAEETRVMEAWGPAYARAVGLETAFLGAMPDQKNRCPKANDASASRAWPSDRTWEYATRALAASYVHGLSDSDRDTYVASFIGNKAYANFATFIEGADLPNVADLLDGRIAWTHNPKRLDRTAAVLNSAVALIAPPKAAHRKERAERLWVLVDSIPSLDLVVPTAQVLMDAGLHTAKEAIRPLSKLMPMLRKTGMLKGGR